MPSTQLSSSNTRTMPGTQMSSSTSTTLFRSAKAFRSSLLYRSSNNRAKAAGRILVNLATINSIITVVTLVMVLAAFGVFHRHIVDNDLSHDVQQPFGQNCRLDANGFSRGTCQLVEIATTTKSAWNTIGQQLALTWRAPLYVSTCVKTKSDQSGQVALVFLAVSHGFPQCQPSNGPQEIAGVAMLETTVRDEFQDGVYMLAVFDDKTMSGSENRVISDGSTDLLMANLNRTLIATNGSVVLDITARIQQNRWNVGQTSKRAIMLTWQYGHQVDHGDELLAVQLSAILISCVLVSGDFYLTVQGLQGFLHHKPNMTYDLAAGLERRKLVVFCWVVAHIVSLIYPDVMRAYFKATVGLWLIVGILVDTFFICATFLAMALIQYIPSPFTHVATLSSTVMGHGLFLIAPLWVSQTSAITQHFHDAPISLGLNISGVVRSSGTFANGGLAKSSMHFMLPATFALWVICILGPLLVSQINRKRHHGTFLLNLAWTRTNCFMDNCRMPNWITGLPLDERKMIKIGNKLFCKPSTQATLGIATVVPRIEPDDVLQKPHRGHDDKKMTLVSICSLVPIVSSMHRWLPKGLQPKIVGTVHKNELTTACYRTPPLHSPSRKLCQLTLVEYDVDLKSVAPR
ncbi:hypothetical protein AeMF1_003607 [Aphanomyces euteiches]|nr:hypothetical protein AeMF1_003607 [Aphanomyces euteiches]